MNFRTLLTAAVMISMTFAVGCDDDETSSADMAAVGGSGGATGGTGGATGGTGGGEGGVGGEGGAVGGAGGGGECVVSVAPMDPAPEGYPAGCEEGCGALGSCALDTGLCAGLAECDRAGVVDMCLAICTEQLLGVFGTLDGCEAIIGLANQALPGFDVVCAE
jgi:hypothetical protein